MNIVKLFVPLLLATTLISCSISPVDNSRLQQESFSDIAALKLSVGDTAPTFILPNGDGKMHALETLLTEKHVMLIFYRGEWCPFCMSQLESFESVLPALSKKNVQLVAISPDELNTNKNTQRNFGLDYLFLSDTSLNTVNAYGIAAKADSDLPHPAIFLINQKGKIVWFHASEDYKERPTGEQMLSVVNRLLPAS